jgi:uncharacterized surface protein with fasciclin (FAS1) repeats
MKRFPSFHCGGSDNPLRLYFMFIAVVAAVLMLSGCNDDDDDKPSAQPKTILETARENANLSSLVAALDFASNGGDLVALVSNPGTLTVFAPTNAAFDALARDLTGSSTATAATILVPANRDLVRGILQYHVLTSRVASSQIQLGRAIVPAGGNFFKIEQQSGGLVITDGRNRTSNITTANVEATNGIVHVIDRVLLPPNRSIVGIATDATLASTTGSLVAALQFADQLNPGETVGPGLIPLLNGAGTFTVFAPTNAAFTALATELGTTVAALLDPASPSVAANRTLVRNVLRFHVLTSRVLRAEIPANTAITPALGATGGTFTIAVPATGNPAITDARNRVSNITATDTFATNGVVHIIDRVLLPRP